MSGFMFKFGYYASFIFCKLHRSEYMLKPGSVRNAQFSWLSYSRYLSVAAMFLTVCFSSGIKISVLDLSQVGGNLAYTLTRSQWADHVYFEQFFSKALHSP